MVDEAIAQLEAGIAAMRAVDTDTLTDPETERFQVATIRGRVELLVVSARATRRWEGSGIWSSDGSKSAAARLARDLNWSLGDARREIRVGRALDAMPHVAAALTAGTIGPAHVDLFAKATETTNSTTANHPQRDRRWPVTGSGRLQGVRYGARTRDEGSIGVAEAAFNPVAAAPEHFIRGLDLGVEQTTGGAIARVEIGDDIRCDAGLVATAVDVIGGHLAMLVRAPAFVATTHMELHGIDRLHGPGELEAEARLIGSSKRRAITEVSLRLNGVVALAHAGFAVRGRPVEQRRARTGAASRPGRQCPIVRADRRRAVFRLQPT